MLVSIDAVGYPSGILSLFVSTGSSCVSIACNQKNPNEFQQNKKQNKTLHLEKLTYILYILIFN